MKKEKYIYSNLKEGKKKYGKTTEIFHYRGYELGIWDDDPGQCLFTIWHDQEIGFGTYNLNYEDDCRYLIDKELDDIYRKDGVHVKWFQGEYSGYRDIICEFRSRLVKVWLVDGTDPDLDAIIAEAKEICAKLEAERLAAIEAGDPKAGMYFSDIVKEIEDSKK